MKVEILDLIKTERIGLNSYVFSIKDCPRFVLQELARHRQASYSVKSSRYTLMKEFRNEEFFTTLDNDARLSFKSEALERAKKYIDISENTELHIHQLIQLDQLLEVVKNKAKNSDEAKYLLPETWLCDLVWTIDEPSLNNFLELRTSGAAHFRIRDLANLIKDKIGETI